MAELEVCRGPRHDEAGERRAAGYPERFGLDVGHMLSLDFDRRKEPGLRRVEVAGRVLWEETV